MCDRGPTEIRLQQVISLIHFKPDRRILSVILPVVIFYLNKMNVRIYMLSYVNVFVFSDTLEIQASVILPLLTLSVVKSPENIELV